MLDLTNHIIETDYNRLGGHMDTWKFNSEIQRIYGEELRRNQEDNWVFWFQRDKSFVTCIIKKCLGMVDGMLKIQVQEIGPTGDGLEMTTFVLDKVPPTEYFDRQLSIQDLEEMKNKFDCIVEIKI